MADAETIVRDLIARTENAVASVAGLSAHTGATFRVEDVVNTVERGLPADYPVPTTGDVTRRDLITRIVQDMLEGETIGEASDGQEGPDIIVRHNPAGWPLPDYSDLADCTTNHQPQHAGRPACTAPAVWRVVEDHGMHLTISFWCDAHLSDEHRSLA